MATASFSSLTLFECTIGNATMLVESMSNKDLLSAWRISGQLQNKIVEVLDPRMSELTEVAEEHSRCSLFKQDSLASLTTDAGASSIVRNEQHYDDSAERVIGPPASKIKRMDSAASPSNSEKSAVYNAESPSTNYFHNSSSTLLNVKKEENDEESDDCMILEEMVGFSMPGISSPATVSQQQHHHFNFNSSNFGSPCRGRSSRGFGRGSSMHSNGSNSGVTAASSDPITESRNVMRQVYKQLKGDGPHLFDFSKPFQAAVNQAVATRVTENARLLPQCQQWDEATLNKAVSQHFQFTRYNSKLNRRSQKLGRRQRAFEALMQSAEVSAPDQLDKYRTILSREFTSSDEEIDDDESGENFGARNEAAVVEEDDHCPLLRVRSLVWESAEVRMFKSKLDTVYHERFATERQRLQLTRSKRDGSIVSRRPKPRGAPDWTVNKDRQ